MNGKTFDVRFPGDRDAARKMQSALASLTPAEVGLMEAAATEAQSDPAGYHHIRLRRLRGFNFGFTSNAETGRAAVFSFDKFPAHFLKPPPRVARVI